VRRLDVVVRHQPNLPGSGVVHILEGALVLCQDGLQDDDLGDGPTHPENPTGCERMDRKFLLIQISNSRGLRNTGLWMTEPSEKD
jgi:hypothetical protein